MARFNRPGIARLRRFIVSPRGGNRRVGAIETRAMNQNARKTWAQFHANIETSDNSHLRTRPATGVAFLAPLRTMPETREASSQTTARSLFEARGWRVATALQSILHPSACDPLRWPGASDAS